VLRQFRKPRSYPPVFTLPWRKFRLCEVVVVLAAVVWLAAVQWQTITQWAALASDVGHEGPALLDVGHGGPTPGDGTALAYIGPGAGIALFGSFLTIFIALISAAAALLMWPLRLVWRLIRGRHAYKYAQVPRVVVLGLDGLDPGLATKFMDEGLLPNLKRLRDEGSFRRLGTTWPPLSPVAWSSFSTGANPGKHNVFDFLTRNPADYRPTISSVRLREPRRKFKLGPYVIPLSKAEITLTRKSKPWWCVLSDAGIFSAILRVPVTFPPDKFRGVQLSAMCVPDLRGSQGIFSHYVETGQEGATMDGDVGGDQILVKRNGRAVESYLRGPANTLRVDRAELRLPFRVISDGNGAAKMQLDGQEIRLPLNKSSEWVRFAFHPAPVIKVHGICQFLLKSFEPPFDLYCTPLHIDPAKPVMPISHPASYATYLAAKHGTYATLGLAEDTWSLSEKVVTEDDFLAQTWEIHAEREAMFFDTLRCVRQGAVACVFDTPDRVQHMFFRFFDEKHPALQPEERASHAKAFRDMYTRMDDLVGRTLEAIGDETALLIMSDHGFKPFRRGVDLNAWLVANGYMVLKDGAKTASHPYLVDIDWGKTRAYAIGLAGIYINKKGREGQGIVAPGEGTRNLLRELRKKLTGLRDEERGEVGIREAVISTSVYRGPYIDQGPDLIVGYNIGYRVSWDAAVGKAGAAVFEDNKKAWSGDHCLHPALVPGVLFSNMKLAEEPPNIIDVGPTVLDLLGVDKPGYMDGKSLLPAEAE
jgi:predicted AlkP superfamily phosphohydrolase/phosphomutase